MRTALVEPTTQTPPVPAAQQTAAVATSHTEVMPTGGPVRWRSQFFSEPNPNRAAKRRPTRYERFTTRMVLVSSIIMLGVTACLHVFNYGLETKTSSTSGTHGSFYKENE